MASKDRDTERIVADIPSDLKTQVKVKAAHERVALTDVLQRLLEGWVSGRIPTPSNDNDRLSA
jgi:hypothetical protein